MSEGEGRGRFINLQHLGGAEHCIDCLLQHSPLRLSLTETEKLICCISNNQNRGVKEVDMNILEGRKSDYFQC